MKREEGSTLIELLVTLALMGVIAAVVTLALKPRSVPAPDPNARVADARRASLSTRRPVTVDFVQNDTPYTLTAFPDGRVIANSALRVDQLTGEKGIARP